MISQLQGAAWPPTPRTLTTEIARAAQAGQRQSVVCRWVLNEPAAADHVAKIAEGPDQGPLTEDHMDVEGALVYACLLHLTDHPESAQFWWQLAAGAGSRAAAYCRHLHHLAVGESKRAWHWFHQLTHAVADTTPPDAAFLEGLEIFARYVRTNGSRALGPTGSLESEIDRLAARPPGCSVIVARPDRQLVDRLQEFMDR
ncbi:hypothetical protein ABZT04_43580 [Streptomyces sp. NPDC005492]|uniref:hypothetical protein n=1 Tax=Streptomyces sp. NPDC005492 TaxID=3156883 RepID=UPI0033B512E4